MDTINHYIGGRVVEGTSGRYGEVYNPALGEQVRQVGDPAVRDVSRVTIEDEQPRVLAARRGLLRDQLGGQVEVEVGRAHRGTIPRRPRRAAVSSRG